MNTIVENLERLFQDQVNISMSGNGNQEAGFCETETSIGWYCSGGNIGECICSWSGDQAVEILKTLKAIVSTNKNLKTILKNVPGITWYI
ncbi:MAG: hypothetical protein ACREVA_00105 [Burkholderiales bacterium]